MYQCSKCRKTFMERAAQCKCGAWNSHKEVDLTPGPQLVGGQENDETVAAPITSLDVIRDRRYSTGLIELNRVLGGDEHSSGLVYPSVVLLSGEPGIGKSTLVLQAAANVARLGHRVLYATGEESRSAVTARAQRLNAKDDNLFLVADSVLGRIEQQAKEVMPRLIILDSVQTMTLPEIEAEAGSVSQVKGVGNYLPKMARTFDASILLIGHVTKEGGVAGPKTLEHLVDATLHFEGEQGRSLRMLRTHKNRFGSTMEVGLFEMAPDGLVDIESPSAHLLAQRRLGQPGSGITAMCGQNSRRAMLVEVQALVGLEAQRLQLVATGIDTQRVQMLLAVLDRKARLSVGNKQLFVNVVGGMTIDEPAADLAMTLTLASAVANCPLPEDLVAFGELGLSGELRDTTQAVLRLKEAAKMGFKRALVPPFKGLDDVSGIELVRAETLTDAIEVALGPVEELVERIKASQEEDE